MQRLSYTNISHKTALQRAASISCDVQYEDFSDGLRTILVSLFVFQSTFFMLRMASRITRLAPWGRDDTTILVAWVGFPMDKKVTSECPEV